MLKEADASGTASFPFRETHGRYIVLIYWLIFIFSQKHVYIHGIFIHGVIFNAFVLCLCGMPLSSGHQVHRQPDFYLTTQRPFAPASSTYKHYLSPALQAAQQDSQRIRRLFLSYSEE